MRVVEVCDDVCADDPGQEGDVCVRRCEACWWAVVHVDVMIGYGCGMACEAGVQWEGVGLVGVEAVSSCAGAVQEGGQQEERVFRVCG